MQPVGWVNPMIARAIVGFLALGGIGLAVSGSLAKEPSVAWPGADPLALYGEEVRFDVYREGDKVGHHRVNFGRDGDYVTVNSNFLVEIDLLFFTAYRFQYESEGRWRDGKLQRLVTSVDDDGDPFSMKALRQGDQIVVQRPGEKYATTAPLFPTNHWNPQVLGQDRVLNTLTGRINEVRIEPRGREKVATEFGPVEATRYAYSGQLNTEVWYDDAGRWVKMRFAGEDGSTIDYVCRLCQGEGVNTAQN